jgi:hypothetical protein
MTVWTGFIYIRTGTTEVRDQWKKTVENLFTGLASVSFSVRCNSATFRNVSLYRQSHSNLNGTRKEQCITHLSVHLPTHIFNWKLLVESVNDMALTIQ